MGLPASWSRYRVSLDYPMIATVVALIAALIAVRPETTATRIAYVVSWFATGFIAFRVVHVEPRSSYERAWRERYNQMRYRAVTFDRLLLLMSNKFSVNGKFGHDWHTWIRNAPWPDVAGAAALASYADELERTPDAKQAFEFAKDIYRGLRRTHKYLTTTPPDELDDARRVLSDEFAEFGLDVRDGKPGMAKFLDDQGAKQLFAEMVRMLAYLTIAKDVVEENRLPPMPGDSLQGFWHLGSVWHPLKTLRPSASHTALPPRPADAS